MLVSLSLEGGAGALECVRDDSKAEKMSTRAPSGAHLGGLEKLRHSGLEVRSSTSIGPAAAISGSETSVRANDIRDLLHEYFAPHIVAGSNEEAFSVLIEDRTRRLLQMGESAGSIRNVMAKANRLDLLAELARGFICTAGFAVAGRVLDAQPGIGASVVAGIDELPGLRDAPLTFKGGLAAGSVQGAADHVWNDAFAHAMQKTQWLDSAKEDLEDSMIAAKEAGQPDFMRSVGENALAIQTFRGRDTVRILFALGAVGSEVDSWVYAAGALFAGAAYAGVLRAFNSRHHRIGPEYLLGRLDWQEQYQALKAATWTDAVANGTGRMAKGAVKMGNAVVGAAHSLTSATGLAKSVGALGVGSGLSDLAGAAASSAVGSRFGAAAARAAQFAVSVGVGPAWTTAALATSEVVGRARELSEGFGNVAQDGVGATVRKGLNLAKGRLPTAVPRRLQEGAAARYEEGQSFLDLGA